MGNLKQSLLARGSKVSKNPAIEILKKQPVSQTDAIPSSAELEKYQNKPAVKAREALDQLFLQAKGLSGLSPFNSYTLAPVAPTYKPVVGGDPVAILKYAWLVRAQVANLNSLMATHRELLLPISRKCFSWPMLISKRKVVGDDPDKIIVDSQVGEDTIANDDYESLLARAVVRCSNANVASQATSGRFLYNICATPDSNQA